MRVSRTNKSFVSGFSCSVSQVTCFEAGGNVETVKCIYTIQQAFSILKYRYRYKECQFKTTGINKAIMDSASQFYFIYLSDGQFTRNVPSFNEKYKYKYLFKYFLNTINEYIRNKILCIENIDLKAN